MTLRQQQPVVPRMLHQTPTGLDEPLLHTGQRPAFDPPRQHQPPPQIPEVVGQHAQLQPDLVRPEPVTREPRPMRGLLAFLDPLLRRPALVVEPHDGAIGELEIRHDEADAREQLADMVLDFRDDPPRLRPTARLIRKALVPDERLAAGPPRRPGEKTSNIPLQILIGRNADRIRHTALLKCLVDFWFGKRRIGSERDVLALGLLALDFRDQ